MIEEVGNETSSSATTSETPVVIPEKEAFQRLQGDLVKWKQKAREYESNLQKVAEERKLTEIKTLEEQQKYKELYERANKEAETYKQKVVQTQQAYLNDVKFQALEREALRAGIRQEALEDLRLFNTDNIIVETTSTGNANVLGGREFVESLKQSKPYLFVDSTAPKINTTIASGVVESKEMSISELLKLEKKDPERYNKEMLKRISKKK